MTPAEQLIQFCEQSFGKVVHFEFPKQGQDVAFFIDQPAGGKRLWFMLTESAIPSGTVIRLSEMDEEAWKQQALKRLTRRAGTSKGRLGLRGVEKEEGKGDRRESIDG